MAYSRETKPCTRPGCTELCVKRRREARKDWEKRRFHSHACAELSPRFRAPGPPAGPPQTKPCARVECDKLVVKRPNCGVARWEAILYCSRDCHKLVRAGSVPSHKECKGCGRTFHRPDGMPTDEWRRRQFCETIWMRCPGMAEKWAVVRRKGVEAVKVREPKPAKVVKARPTMAPAPTGTRRKGNTMPTVTRMARAAGDAERAADLLRFRGAVYPMSTILKPHLPPSSNDTHWHVHGRVMSVERMIEEAGL
jgi:hypothetical protein